jgi:SAM-dependent methyltransferase
MASRNVRIPDEPAIPAPPTTGLSTEVVENLPDAILAGQRAYTPGFLKLYELVVGLNNALFWRCSSSHMLRLYDRHVSARHLEIGVGTGRMLGLCHFPTPKPEITLMDLNPSSLAAAAQRLRDHAPRTHRANALEPFGLAPDAYDSIAINYLLHCLPGDIDAKAAIFDHCRDVLAPGGVVFGATVLGEDDRHTAPSRAALAWLNHRGVFCNRADDLAGLERALDTRFTSSTVEIVGAVALFAARR